MQITDTEREFIRLVRETRFGRIEGFRLSGGIPVVDDDTDVYQEYKLSGTDSPQEAVSDDIYLTKPQVRALLDRFRMIQDATIECLDVRDGLPFKVSVKRSALR